LTKNRDTRERARRRTARRHPRRAWLLWLAGILALTFAAYLPSLGNGFTNFDDTLYVLANPLLIHPNGTAVLTTPVACNYHPITIWSLALNYRLSGFNPTSYHWLNLLLHLANTGLVFVFVRKLSNDRLWTAGATSLLFGIHPMHVESVAWISERKDVLYAFFYLLALIAYLRYLDRRKPAWLVSTLIAAVLSMASKPAAVVLPLTLLAIDFYRRRPFQAGIVLEKTPIFAASLVFGILTLHAQHMGGAIDPHPWGPRKLLFASYGILMYVVKLFAPVHLSAFHPYPDAARPLGLEFYIAFALVVLALPALAYLCRRSRPVLFGLAFFIINIMLVLQYFTVGGAMMAERYTYLPYIGLFFALAWWLDERPAPASPKGVLRFLLAAMMLLLALFSLVQTWSRCGVWRNSETLWTDVIVKYPHRILGAYYLRGDYYKYDKRLDEALADFNHVTALNPRMAEGWLNKGIVLAELGRSDSAIVCFDRVLQIKPDLFDAWNNRATLKLRKGNMTGGLADLSRAIAINPRYRDAYSNRAAAYFMLKEYEKSIADSRRVIELDPQNPNNFQQYGSIGVALQKLKHDRDAIAELDKAIRFAPNGDSHLGVYYVSRSYAKWALGERAGALNDAREARRLGTKVDPAVLQQIESSSAETK
jgi:protein O-mannosyl-transferase